LVDGQAVKQLGRCEVRLKTIDLNILGQIVSDAMAVKHGGSREWEEAEDMPRKARNPPPASPTDT
jgi:hypothetical protein